MCVCWCFILPVPLKKQKLSQADNIDSVVERAEQNRAQKKKTKTPKKKEEKTKHCLASPPTRAVLE